MTKPDIIRRTILRPYRKGMGPTFTLTIYGPGHMRGNRWCLDYRLTQRDGRKSVTLFEGSDFGPSPLHAWDSDDTVASLLSLPASSKNRIRIADPARGIEIFIAFDAGTAPRGRQHRPRGRPA